MSKIDGPAETGLVMTAVVVQRLHICLLCVCFVANNVFVDRHVTRLHAGSNVYLPGTGIFGQHTSANCALVRPSQDARARSAAFLSIPGRVVHMVTNLWPTYVQGVSDKGRDVTSPSIRLN